MINGDFADFGNYTVPYPEETSADRGGGPIRREGRPLVLTNYSMTLNPTPIMRTPHGVGNDPEPGNNWLPELLTTKMLPDGRIVDQSALRGADLDGCAFGNCNLGALSPTGQLKVLFGSMALVGGVVVGGVIGTLLAAPGTRVSGLGKGALMGASAGAMMLGGAAIDTMLVAPAGSLLGAAGIGASAGLIYGAPGNKGKAAGKGATVGVAAAASLGLIALASAAIARKVA